MWKFLLGYYSWDSTYKVRTEQRKQKVWVECTYIWSILSSHFSWHISVIDDKSDAVPVTNLMNCVHLLQRWLFSDEVAVEICVSRTRKQIFHNERKKKSNWWVTPWYAAQNSRGSIQDEMRQMLCLDVDLTLCQFQKRRSLKWIPFRSQKNMFTVSENMY